MKKLKKYNKTFKFLMILGMFLNMLMPTGGMTVVAENQKTGEIIISENIINNMRLMYKDKTEFEDGDLISVD